MTRGQSKKHKEKNDAKLSQTPAKDIVEDGRDVEFASEFADQEDREAQKRANAADERAKQHKQH